VVNEILVPRSTDWVDRIMHRYVPSPDDTGSQQASRGYFNTRARRLWQFTTYHMRSTEMLGPKVSWPLRDGSWRELKAERALNTNAVWTFFNVTEYAQASETASELMLFQTNVLAMPEFKETPKDIARDIRFSKYEGLHSKKLNIPLVELWGYLDSHPDLPKASASLWHTKLDGRLAAPFTCLVVVLIAIPFGAPSGRRNLFFGVAGSIFICFAFFVVQQFSLALGTGGYLASWLAAWLPNMIFGVAGLWLTARVR
jgi:lipopolysaccharide export LptBFGC system permease protein LptF